jgi:hypothetical protein
MSLVNCRDCGYSIDPDWRGCPGCARNLEAERMIDKCLKWVVGPLLLVLCIALAGLVWYARK